MRKWKEGKEGVPPSRLLVHGDEGNLRQVLINLLGNAVKFIDAGEVVLRISEETDQPIDENTHYALRTTHDASRFTFEVIDTGPGIPPNMRATIFDTFTQGEEGAKKGGTGLGLAISKRQVALMGGELSVESEPGNVPSPGGVGVGSRFFFTLPLPPAKSDTVSESSQWRNVTRLAQGCHVKALIADDTKINREVLSRFLGNLGVEVTEVENGQQAVERVRTNRPDIVFMDIRMPVMDGLSATCRIFEEQPADFRPKMVAISASVLKHQQEEYLAVGFDDFVPKPFRFERICECLANLLHVEYESAESMSTDHEETPQIDFTTVALPEALRTRLMRAAELYNLTSLNQCLNEMEGVGPDGHHLAEHLRGLMRNYDMEAMLALLSAITGG